MTEDNFYNLTAYGDTSGDRVHKALSVLHYAEIQEILKNNKTLLRLMNYGWGAPEFVDAGMGAAEYDIDDKANISLSIDPNALLDWGDKEAAGIVSIRGAKIIDLTGNGVSSASNLKELWEDVPEADLEAGYHRMIKVSLVFNDKYNDDDFRDVYALIITSAKEGDLYKVIPVEEEEGIDVTINLTEDLGKRVISNTNGAEVKYNIYDNGDVEFDSFVATYADDNRTVVGHITVTIAGSGKITKVEVEIDEGAEVDVDSVTVITTNDAGESVVNAKAEFKAGATEVENLEPVKTVPTATYDPTTSTIKFATAGVDADTEEIVLVNEDGESVGTIAITVTEGDGDELVITVDDVLVDEDATGENVPEVGDTVTVVGVDEEDNEVDVSGEGIETKPGDEVDPGPGPGPDEPAVVETVTVDLSDIPTKLKSVDKAEDFELPATATAENEDGETIEIDVTAELVWDDPTEEIEAQAEGDEEEEAADTLGYTVTITIDEGQDAKFDQNTAVVDQNDADIAIDDVTDDTIIFSDEVEIDADYQGPAQISSVTLDKSNIPASIDEGVDPNDEYADIEPEATWNDTTLTAVLEWNEEVTPGEGDEADAWGYTITISIPAGVDAKFAESVTVGDDTVAPTSGKLVITGAVEVEEPAGAQTLTLKGAKIVGGKVYLGASMTAETGVSTGTAGVVSEVAYEVEAGETVTINVGENDFAAGTYIIPDTDDADLKVTVTAGQADASNKTLTFKMPEASFTLNAAETTAINGVTLASNKYHKVVVEEGLTLTQVTPNTVMDGEEAGTYYVKNETANATISGGDFIVVTDEAARHGTKVADGQATGGITAAAWIYKAAALTLGSNVTASYDKSGTNTSVTGGEGVRPNTMLKVVVETKTGVCVTSETVKAGPNIVSEDDAYDWAMPATATSLTAGYILTLNDVTVTIDGHTGAINSGDVVTANLATAKATQPEGEAENANLGVIASATAYTGAAYEAGGLLADTTLSAAVKINLKDTQVKHMNALNEVKELVPSDGTAADVWFRLGIPTTIYFDGDTALAIKDAGNNAVTPDEGLDGAVYGVVITREIAGWKFEGTSANDGEGT